MQNKISFYLSIDEQNLFLHQGLDAMKASLINFSQQEIHCLIESIDGDFFQWLFENNILPVQGLN